MDGYEAIPAYRWEHADGRTASIYGAVPEPNAGEAGSPWQVVQRGWTVRRPDGCTGVACLSFGASEERARAVAAELNAAREARKRMTPRA